MLQGNATGGLGRWEEAKDYYGKAASLSPEFAFSVDNYAVTLFQTGDTKNSVRLLRNTLRKYPNFDDARAALAAMLWSLGVCLCGRHPLTPPLSPLLHLQRRGIEGNGREEGLPERPRTGACVFVCVCVFVCGHWCYGMYVTHPADTLQGGGGGGFAAGIFRRGILRVSNSCEISHIIFRPLCGIKPLRNLAKCLVQQLPEHKSVVPSTRAETEKCCRQNL